MDNITGVVVCYNTKGLIERAYNSVRKFHPDMPIIIVDSSSRNDPCASYVNNLKSDKATIINPGRNIGHGRGMHQGIMRTETKYALIFDSDVQMVSDCVPAMLEKMEENTFGIGAIGNVGLGGNSVRPIPSNPRARKFIQQRKRHKKRRATAIPYLHPFFHLINVQNYKKYQPYVHHGAPCLLTMYDIYKKGLSKTILINFPNLKEHVKHDGRGTRIKYGLDSRTDPWKAIR